MQRYGAAVTGFLTFSRQFISTEYMEGLYTHELTPDYSLELGKRSTKPGYAMLNFLAAYFLTYQVMDLLYQQMPVANLYMERGSAKQERVCYLQEYKALGSESQKELLPVSLSIDIKDWLRKFLKRCISEENSPIKIPCRKRNK